MIVILVCLLQITVTAGIASAAARVCLDRSPRLSARFSLLGIFLSTIVVLATCCDMPRLWTFQPPGREGEHSVRPPAGRVNQVRSQPSADFELLFGFTAQELMQQVNQIRNRHPVAESRLADGCLVLAVLLFLLGFTRCVVGSCWLWSLGKARSLSRESLAALELTVLAAKSGVSFPVRLRASELLSSPCVSWLSRGTIYVPADFEQWSPDERHVALAHELTHEVRRDPQTRFFAELCSALLYFHPLMLLLRRQLTFAQELATDRQAAGLLGSLKTYQRGLSLLALRMDTPRTATFLVSVSTNDVIRRIKMLSSTRPTLSRWQETISVAAILFVSVIAAAWTANADDPIRAVSRQKIDVSNSETTNQPRTILPWEQLGEQAGYVVIKPRELAKHPVFRSVYDAHVTEALAGFDLNAFGLNPEGIKSVQLPLILDIMEIPEEQRLNHDGHRHQLKVGASSVVMETVQPIAWARVSNLIPPHVTPPAKLAALREQLANFDQQTVMRLVPEASKTSESLHATELKSVWGEVSDCPLAVASATPDAFELSLDEESDAIDARALFSTVHATAIGIALDSKDGHPQIRFAFAPRKGHSASEVLNLVKNTQEKIVASGQAIVASRPDSLSNESKLNAVEELLEEFAAVKLKIVAAADGSEIVVATMQLTANMENLLP